MALQQIIQLMGASEIFAQFINTEGLMSLLDNVDIRGIDELKIKADQFMEQVKQQQQAAAQQPDPMQQMIDAQTQVEAAKIEQRREQSQGELQIKAAQLAIDKEKADTEFMYLLSEIEALDAKNAREAQRLDADLTKDAVDMAMHVSEKFEWCE